MMSFLERVLRRLAKASPFLRRTILRLGLPVARRWWALTAPITVGARAIIADRDGRVVLVRHTYGERHWYLPGGMVHRREQLFDAMCREIQEETGLEVTTDPTKVEILGVYTNFFEGKSDHVAVFVFGPGDWSGQIRAKGGEIDRVAFFAPDDLPEHSAPSTRKRLAEHAGRRPVDYRW